MQLATKNDVTNLITSSLPDSRKVELLAHFTMTLLATQELLQKDLDIIEQKTIDLANRLAVRL